MKKDLLVVYPYKFTNFEFYKFELDKLKYNIKILDLSFSNKKFRKSWKSSNFRKSFLPKNFFQLVRLHKKLLKNNPIVLNIGDEKNLWTTYIKFLIKKKNLKEIILKDVDIWGVEIKKNSKWFLGRILEHKLNFKLYFYYIKYYFYKTIFYFLKHKKEFIFSLHGNDKNYIHNFDYSNSIGYKKTRGKKRYVIYLDNGSPYFKGDTDHQGYILPDYNVKRIYKDYINFFSKIEKVFSCKVVVIPHPKYKSYNKKIKSFNPFFKNLIVDNRVNAINARSSETIFFLSKGSTASAYAAIQKKPIIFFYSSNHKYGKYELEAIKYHAKCLGTSPLNIKNFDRKKTLNLLKINKKKYLSYINTYLVHNEKKKNEKNYSLLLKFLRDYKN